MYKVIKMFRETEHDGHIYNIGDVYPVEGKKADAKRVKLLQGNKNKYKTPFLGEAVKQEKVADKSSDAK